MTGKVVHFIIIFLLCNVTIGNASKKKEVLSDEIEVTFWQIVWAIFFGCLAFYIIGLTPQDVIYGVPLNKCITTILWPTEKPFRQASNTKTVSVSFTSFNGQLVKNPMAQCVLEAQVLCDSQAVTFSLMESENGEEVLIVFNASKAGLYKIQLTANGNLVRGFPTSQRILSGPVENFQSHQYKY